MLEKCPTLFQYMQYVDRVRHYRKDYPLDEAVPLAVDYCIANGILRDFLLANKAEVTKKNKSPEMIADELEEDFINLIALFYSTISSTHLYNL